MKELIVCPKCKRPTVIMEKIYAKPEMTEISLEEFAKKEIEFERHKEGQSSSGDTGDISFMNFGHVSLATQLFFKCTTCGYIEVHNV